MSFSFVRKWAGAVSDAALVFESRWTLKALARVDPALAVRFREQRDLFDAACVTGTDEEVETHGAAMCRAYAAVSRVLEGAQEPDDAYVIGFDATSGTRVAIGSQKAALARVRELHGERVIWVTPDEVASLFASLEQFKFVGAVKQLFPGAEIVDRFPEEPAKADGYLEPCLDPAIEPELETGGPSA